MSIDNTTVIKGLTVEQENSLTPAKVTITPGGTAGTTTTITSSQTANISVDLKHLSGVTEDIAATYARLDSEGVPNGIATLDNTGKIPNSQLPTTAMEYLGNWNASANTPTLADGIGNTGDVYRVNVAATRNLGSGSIVWNISDWVVYNGTIWEQAPSPGSVTSVFARTGAIIAQSGDYTKAQVGLSNVDNTSDTTKFTSTPLTGIPTAPTAANGTNTTQLATTAFANAITVTNSNLVDNTISATKLTNSSVTNTQLGPAVRQLNKRIFFGSSGFLTPANTSASTVFKITAIGGGGGGGKWTAGNGSGGGGGGATAITWVTGVAAGTNFTISIGLGGTGSVTNTVDGTLGGATYVNYTLGTVIAAGGAGGIANGDIACGGPGGRLVDSTGDLRMDGTCGGNGGNNSVGGTGGSSSMGGGGTSGVSSVTVNRAGGVGGFPGGGGGGGINFNGGDGSQGFAIIEWVV